MTHIAQNYRPVVINGQNFNVSRGGAGRAMIGPVAPPTKTAILTALRIYNDSRPSTVTPPPTNSRASLVPLYGSYTPSVNAADYTQNQVGATSRLLDLNEFNAASTQSVTFSTSQTITDKIIYGRVFKNAGVTLEFQNCIFLGPSARITTESGVIAFDSPGATGVAHFLDCTIAPRYPQPNLNCTKGSKMKLERCHLFWGVDGNGPYSTSWPTEFEIVASRVERLVCFPGKLYAAIGAPNYWTGSTWTSGTAGKVARTDSIGWIDDGGPNNGTGGGGHFDMNHSDAIQIHGAMGYYTFNQSTGKWETPSGQGGIHIWGNAVLPEDAYGLGDPSGLGIPVPGTTGSVAGSFLGYGDNYLRGLPAGGQQPGMTRPVTSGWTKPLYGRDGGLTGGYPTVGVGIYIGQIVNQFQYPNTANPNRWSVVIHDNYIDKGNMHWQEQKQAFSSISFALYDNTHGPGVFMWNSNLKTTCNTYPIRINDGTVAGSAIGGANDSIVKIAPHPVTGDHWTLTERWDDPANVWLRNGQTLINGNSNRGGIRYG